MDTKEEIIPLTWAEIDLDSLGHNVRELRKKINPDVGMMIAVKADAYGHGASQVSRAAFKNGASFLAVARIEEAVKLRADKIDAPMLLLGHCRPEYVGPVLDMDVRVSVNSMEDAESLSAAASAIGKNLQVHVKVDTGMGRLGILSAGLSSAPGENPAENIKKIAAMPRLELEGIFTHFASADSGDRSSAEAQTARFLAILKDIDGAGLRVKYVHAANSAAAINMPHAHFSMTRPGIAVYGLPPFDGYDKTGMELRPVMSMKSRVVQLKKVGAGFHVSYGGTHITEKDTVIATVPVGYADGYNRHLSNKGIMLVRGQRARVVGRVCMDLAMLDVGHIPSVALGDEVVVFGRQGDEYIGADELASLAGTISYEIITAVSPRVKRVYLGG
ncbi:MAG: alanine racemase [Leptospirales bacterium]|nr:alanine racemase [Leptospirales bacterium]